MRENNDLKVVYLLSLFFAQGMIMDFEKLSNEKEEHIYVGMEFDRSIAASKFPINCLFIFIELDKLIFL